MYIILNEGDPHRVTGLLDIELIFRKIKETAGERSNIFVNYGNLYTISKIVPEFPHSTVAPV